MRRRDLIKGIAGSAAAWPLAARAQQSTIPVIGWLSSGSRDSDGVLRLPVFRQGLNEAGYVEGRNVVIEYRNADDQNDRLPRLAADLAGRQVSLILPRAVQTAHWQQNRQLAQFRLFSTTRPMPCSSV